jgi:hypothetical protein
MRRTVASAFAGIATLLVVGCATIVVDATGTEPQARPAREAGYPIQVLNEEVPARPHKVIGSVRARVKLSQSRHNIAPPGRIIAALKQQARALGGDALLPITVRPATGGGNYLSPPGNVLAGNSEIWSALVVVWLEP